MCVHVYAFLSASISFFLDFIMDGCICIHFKHRCGKYLNKIYLRKDHERGLRKTKEKNSDKIHELGKRYWSGNELLVHASM